MSVFASSDDALTAAFRVFTLHECMKLCFAPSVTLWVVVCALALLYAAYKPSHTAMAVALTLRIFDTCTLMPFCWDSFYWCIQVDTAGLLYIVTASAASSRSSIAAAWADSARPQLAMFYLAASFWKINTSFLDARTSCAPMFFLTLLPTLGWTPSHTIATLIRDAAPLMTILGEASIGVLLLAPSRRIQRLGVVVALLLHMGISLTPSPNNATPFSLACVVRLLYTQSSGFGRALGGDMLAVTLAVAVAAASVTTGVAYLRAVRYNPPMPPAAPDWWIFLYTVLSVFCVRAVVEEEKADAAANTATAKTKETATSVPSWIKPTFVAVAAFYAFGGPMLGTQDLGASNMYSNLLMHGKGNHLLSPTDLLQHVYPSAFATIRVEASTSEWINMIYPGEITQSMAAYEVELLRSVEHTGRMFNAMKNRILHIEETAPFVRYTVPALEMRRLLAEARAREEAFSLTYTRLQGVGDEIWRRRASGVKVTLREDGKGGRTCTVYDGATCGNPLGGLLGCACDADEVALQPPPGMLASKFLVQQPYPVLDEEEEDRIVCFGP